MVTSRFLHFLHQPFLVFSAASLIGAIVTFCTGCAKGIELSSVYWLLPAGLLFLTAFAFIIGSFEKAGGICEEKADQKAE